MCAAKLRDGDQESVCLLTSNNALQVPGTQIHNTPLCNSAAVDKTGAVGDREWHPEKLSRDQSIASLRSLVEPIYIKMPEDITFTNMDVKLCKMRWLMKMCVLISLTLVNLQWFQFTIVSHTIVSYYNTSADVVNWTSMIYMLSYVVFTFPVSFLLDNRIVNLRVAMMVSSFLLFCGSVLKAISVDDVDFGTAFFGQVLVALAQVVILNIPSQLAFEWFAVQEKTLICNLSIFGMQLGMLLGFALTPWLVGNHETTEEVAGDLERLNILHVVLTLFQLILVISVFRALPKCPPCYLQAIQKKSRCTRQFFWKTFKILIKSCDFNLLNIAFGLQMGVINTIFTLINPMIIHYLPEAESAAGLIGVTIIASSLFSSLIMILILRHQRNLKFMALLTAGICAISVIVFLIGLLTGQQILLYIAGVVMGISATAFQTIGYEFAFETTFPESDGTVSGVLNVSAQMFGIITTTLVTTTYSSAGHLAGNLLLIGVLLVSISCLSFAKCELKRQLGYLIIDTTVKQLETEEKCYQGPGLCERTPLVCK